VSAIKGKLPNSVGKREGGDGFLSGGKKETGIHGSRRKGATLKISAAKSSVIRGRDKNGAARKKREGVLVTMRKKKMGEGYKI